MFLTVKCHLQYRLAHQAALPVLSDTTEQNRGLPPSERAVARTEWHGPCCCVSASVFAGKMIQVLESEAVYG